MRLDVNAKETVRIQILMHVQRKLFKFIGHASVVASAVFNIWHRAEQEQAIVERATAEFTKSHQWLMWCFAGYYCGLECVLGWAKSRLTMYSSSSGLILKFKIWFGISSTLSKPICFGWVIQIEYNA
ncbi:hypothetical protein Tco_0123884 [Tanacetum coccineum]